ncbi:HD domain-containing protein [Patescibacteria group bacterium]|nr:HD domain-containing protein [Patescibacteria group bacterium]
MDKKQIKILVDLFDKAGTLKDVKRTGWVLKGVEDAESVADHTWRMCLCCVLLADKNVDKQKLVEMCIVHDLGEIEVGDIKWETGKKVLFSPTPKRGKELAVVKEIFGKLAGGRKYINLLKEFNEQKTPEAKLLKQIEKVEMTLQALEYEKRGYRAKKFDEFWENSEKYLKGNSLEPIFRYLQEARKNS